MQTNNNIKIQKKNHAETAFLMQLYNNRGWDCVWNDL